MLIVSDTSPIINLAIINHLHLLPNLFDEIIIPKAVFDEIANKGKGLPGAKEIITANWIKKEACKNDELVEKLLEELDPGEAEAIAISVELSANYILLDETQGRKVALQYNLQPLGILGILLQAKSKGLISEIKMLMDRLMNEANFFIHQSLYDYILQLAKE